MKLKLWYNNILKIDLVYKTNLLNSSRLPKIKKTFINVYSKSVIENPENILNLIAAIRLVLGIKLSICKSKKSISTLKLRKGMITGFRGILKNRNMYNFIYFLIVLSIPNASKTNLYSFASKGNSLSIGVKNLLMFPQINLFYNKFSKGINLIVNIGIKNTTFFYSRILLSGMQIPIK
jgi:large subunit ribosomal protein L5